MSRRPKVRNREQWIPSAVPFFLFGFAYYLVSPAFALKFLSDSNNLLYVATNYLDSSYFDSSYFLDAIVILVSFWLGYFLGKTGTRIKSSAFDYGSVQTNFPSLLAILFFVLIVYFILTANASGAGFFTGYSTYNISILGPFSTCVFMSAWFVNYFSKKQISFLFLSFFVFCSVLLLGWGSRMFFVLGLLALILGLVSKNRELLKSLRLYVFTFTFCLLMLVVGVLREGGGEFSSDRLVGILFAEPLFTAISGALYFENLGGRPVYSVPQDLLASVIHFIPSAVYPGKIELMNSITFNENVESPFGAKSLMVNLYSNFGYFYPIFIAFIGFYYGFLFKKAHGSAFFRATYFSALPILLLLFFREGLVTLMKVMFFNGLIAPLLVALILIWLAGRTVSDIRKRISIHRKRGDSAFISHGTVTGKS